LRPHAERADRAQSVRAAAAGWRRAGIVDDERLAAIEARFPDDRHRAKPAVAALFFLFTLIAIGGAAGFVAALVKLEKSGAIATLLLVFGIGLTALTEILTGSPRPARNGIDAGTSLCAVGFLTAFAGWSFSELAHLRGDLPLAATFGIAAILLAMAAWRWGYALYGGGSAAAFLGGFLFVDGGRLAWIVLPLTAAPLLLRGADSPRLPPAHRAACTTALGVALIGLYAAFNLRSYDMGWLEHFLRYRSPAPFWPMPGLAPVAIAGTVLVPIVYLVLGLRSRRSVFLLTGVATAAASLVTLRYYVHFAPLWGVLAVSGLLLIAVALALRRYLDSGPDHERGGFTAEPLFEDPDRLRLLEAGAAVLSLSPAARPAHDEPKFTGGGGSFGGGGSSSEF
jgi:hypothetical protein